MDEECGASFDIQSMTGADQFNYWIIFGAQYRIFPLWSIFHG